MKICDVCDTGRNGQRQHRIHSVHIGTLEVDVVTMVNTAPGGENQTQKCQVELCTDCIVKVNEHIYKTLMNEFGIYIRKPVPPIRTIPPV